jgi:tRNA pseudouridine13 synthase
MKSQPEDFIVEELPLYEPCGTGTHTYLWIEKKSLNTLDAIKRIAVKLGKRAADGGLAGLKDARAVSRQWISFEHVNAAAQEELRSFSDANLRVLKVTAHGNKLKTGHLRGNRFIIRLKMERDAASVSARAREVLGVLKQRGVPNYFGSQRFGWGGENVELGRFLVKGDLNGFADAWARTHSAARPAERKMRNLLVNAFQSDLFNRVLAQRMPDLGILKAGDLACLHRNGAVFSVNSAEEAVREQPRAEAFEISPSGPMYGIKTLLAQGEPGEIERKVLDESGVTLEDFSRKEAERQPGARRPLRIPFLEDPDVEDEKSSIVLRFALPPGAYATVVLREIVGGFLAE